MKVAALKGRLRRLERAGAVTGQPDIRGKLQRREWSRADALAHCWKMDAYEMGRIGSEPSRERVLGLLVLIDRTQAAMVLSGWYPAPGGNLALDLDGWSQAAIAALVRLLDTAPCNEELLARTMPDDEKAAVATPGFLEKLRKLMDRAERLWAEDERLLARIVGEVAP